MATIERSCVVSNELYVVKYKYNPTGWCMVPATNPPGQTHYPCRVSVFKGTGQVGHTFDGTVTENGCFEDVPRHMVEQAMKEPDLVQIGTPLYITNAIIRTNMLWLTGAITTTNIIYDPYDKFRKALNSYYKCVPMAGEEWWQGPDGARVMDTNMVKLLELWKRLPE